MGDWRPSRVLAALAGLSLVTACSGGESGDRALDLRPALSEHDVALAEATIASRDLIEAVRDERSVASMNLMGVSDAVESPTEDDDARRQTDAVLDGFVPIVGALNDDAESAYQPALDAARGLEAVRSEIDSQPGPPGIAQVDEAIAFFARYNEVLDALLRSGQDAVPLIDDRDLRRGAELFVLGLQQQELQMRALLAIIWHTVSGGQDTSEWVTELASMQAELRAGPAAVEERARGSQYEGAAERLRTEVEAAGFVDLLSEIEETGNVELPALFDSVSLPPDEGWLGFLDSVEGLLIDQFA